MFGLPIIDPITIILFMLWLQLCMVVLYLVPGFIVCCMLEDGVLLMEPVELDKTYRVEYNRRNGHTRELVNRSSLFKLKICARLHGLFFTINLVMCRIATVYIIVSLLVGLLIITPAMLFMDVVYIPLLFEMVAVLIGFILSQLMRIAIYAFFDFDSVYDKLWWNRVTKGDVLLDGNKGKMKVSEAFIAYIANELDKGDE